MIQPANQALRKLIEREALRGGKVEVVFEAPGEDWASRRTAPAVDVFLFDIREDVTRHGAGRGDVRDQHGRVVSRVRPPRWFKLYYVVTAWTQRAEDEHRILTNLLLCFARFEAIPSEFLGPELAGTTVQLKVGQPRAEGASLSDVWSTFGRPWKAAIELVVTIPVDLDAEITAPLVTEPPDVRVAALDPSSAGTATG